MTVDKMENGDKMENDRRFNGQKKERNQVDKQ